MAMSGLSFKTDPLIIGWISVIVLFTDFVCLALRVRYANEHLSIELISD
jgi:hypothetical protein